MLFILTRALCAPCARQRAAAGGRVDLYARRRLRSSRAPRRRARGLGCPGARLRTATGPIAGPHCPPAVSYFHSILPPPNSPQSAETIILFKTDSLDVFRISGSIVPLCSHSIILYLINFCFHFLNSL